MLEPHGSLYGVLDVWPHQRVTQEYSDLLMEYYILLTLLGVEWRLGGRVNAGFTIIPRTLICIQLGIDSERARGKLGESPIDTCWFLPSTNGRSHLRDQLY